MNRAVHSHIKTIMTEDPRPDDPVFLGGGSRPNCRFRKLCNLAGVEPKTDVETGEEQPWLLKDLRKTCATYYGEHIPESSIEILGHSVAGVTCRHYAHRAPLAFKAIMTIPQPSAFAALVTGYDGGMPVLPKTFRGRFIASGDVTSARRMAGNMLIRATTHRHNAGATESIADPA